MLSAVAREWMLLPREEQCWRVLRTWFVTIPPPAQQNVLLPSQEVPGKWRGCSENPHPFRQQDLLIVENIAFYSDLPFPVNATWTWKPFSDRYKPAQKYIIYTVTKKWKKYNLGTSAAEQGIINMLGDEARFFCGVIQLLETSRRDHKICYSLQVILCNCRQKFWMRTTLKNYP